MNRAEIQVRCEFTELLLQSREIEGQTTVVRQGRKVLLWEALKGVTEECFRAWAKAGELQRDAFAKEALAIKERCAMEGQNLVLAALENPLHPKAVARVLLMGHNFLRTLDIFLEAMLRYPSQKSVTPKPMQTDVVIDWAVGGIRDWASHSPYAFEKASSGKKPPVRMAHISKHYATDRTVRGQISHKQIANIFLLRESAVADLERRSLMKLREDFGGDKDTGFDISELADS